MSKTIKILLVSLIFLSACSLFDTRDPETPATSGSASAPATSPTILISNMLTSIKQKKESDYSALFADMNKGDSLTYVFSPSPESKYYSIFASWSASNEKSWFQALINRLVSGEYPKIEFTNGKFDNSSPDFATYTANYAIEFNIIETTVETLKSYSGVIRLTLKPNPNKIWKITEWSDAQDANSPNPTWSALKAVYSY